MVIHQVRSLKTDFGENKTFLFIYVQTLFRKNGHHRKIHVCKNLPTIARFCLFAFQNKPDESQPSKKATVVGCLLYCHQDCCHASGVFLIFANIRGCRDHEATGSQLIIRRMCLLGMYILVYFVSRMTLEKLSHSPCLTHTRHALGWWDAPVPFDQMTDDAPALIEEECGVDGTDLKLAVRISQQYEVRPLSLFIWFAAYDVFSLLSRYFCHLF